ncbi:Cytochrome P450 CYP4/CYP19/CYP26 subfamily [Handroanthus impetiginosus]|uniref:Cytochrome P450 CYP4/CYP19/CYP26 subfamily n=1 Tax=Handroanthus impetiginosus TaxID=429701 RepID=A0A2G9G5A4_9LAMI|nr:Cytochrome P450 CYP4/CYP19/CYP26 subfamily [Handroanthus impetiginosus]
MHGPEFKKIFDIFGDGIFAAESKSWENQRKTIKSLMNDTRFQEYVATTTWNKVETGLIPILELVSEMGMEVDMQELFQRLAYDCSCRDPTSLCIELSHLPHEKAFGGEEAVLYRHILPEIFLKLQRWLHIGKEESFRKGKEVLDKFLLHFISNKQQNFKEIGLPVACEREDFDLLTSYMRVLVEKCDLVLNLISAVKEVGKWKFPNKDELKNLIYLHGALCESLRLFPPVPFQHKAPLEQDALPNGHRINPNTKTVLSFFSMGRMESIWGNDCLEFKPERWISESGCIKGEPSFKFATLNAGPRSFLGKQMSFVQLKITAVAIISHFHFRVREDHLISPSTSVILHMKHGLMVKVSKSV